MIFLRTVVTYISIPLAAVYAVAFTFTWAFYRPIGVAPSEIGLGYLELITPAAIGAGIVCSGLVCFLFATRLLQWQERGTQGDLVFFHVLFALTVGALLLLVGLIGWWTLSRPTNTDVTWREMAATATVIVASLSLPFLILRTVGFSCRRVSGAAIEPKLSGHYGVATAAFMVVLLGLFSGLLGERLSNETLQEGIPYDYYLFGGQLAEVRRSVADPTGSCALLYLGSRDSFVLFDIKRGVADRVSTNGNSVSTYANPDSCSKAGE